MSDLASSLPVLEPLRRELLQRLQTMPLKSFERVVLHLLRSSGYSGVQLVERIDRRGRTLVGGLDLRAYSNTDVSGCLTVVQLKRHRDTIPRRSVDELRGAMLRLRGQHALLVTTSFFSPAAHRAALDPELLPIELIDGRRLVELLVERSLGVKTVQVVREEQAIDEAFFDKVTERRKCTGE